MNENDLDNLDSRFRAQLVNSLSGFKSANLIGTKSNSGQTNLSIVSSVFHLGASPALMGMIIRPDSVARHTLEYIKELGEFTINHVNESISKKAHQTSARYEKNESEFQECGLSEEYLDDLKAPFVKESHVKIGLELVRTSAIEENGTVMVIGKVKKIIFPKNIQKEDGSLNIEEAGTICVSGLDRYHKTEKLHRLSYAKPNIELKEIKE